MNHLIHPYTLSVYLPGSVGKPPARCPGGVLGRRVAIGHSGGAFGSASYDRYGYNICSDLAAARRYPGAYDPQADPDPADQVSPPVRRLYAYDPIGNREESAAGTGFQNGVEVNEERFYCANGVNQYTATSNPAETFAYDADGNLIQDGTFAYTWDGENRLIKAQPLADPPAEGASVAEFAYDYRGRRVRKRVRVYWEGDWYDAAGG